MALYEIVNPSDPYTLSAERLDVACIAGLALGDGQYGLREVGGELVMPIFIFGGAVEWFKDKFGVAPGDFIESNREEIAACMDSVVIGSAGDRALHDLALASIADADKRREYRDAWHDRKRTSMNNIGRRAAAFAKSFRKLVAT